MPSAFFFLIGCLLLAGLLLFGSGRLMQQRGLVITALAVCGLMISLIAWTGEGTRPQLRLDLNGISKRLTDANPRLVVGMTPDGADLVVPPFIDASNNRAISPLDIITVNRNPGYSGWTVDIRRANLGDAQFTACFHPAKIKFDRGIHCEPGVYSKPLVDGSPLDIRLFRIDATGLKTERREIDITLASTIGQTNAPMVRVTLAEPFAINAGRCGNGVASQLISTGQSRLGGDFAFPQIGASFRQWSEQGRVGFDGVTCQFEAPRVHGRTQPAPPDQLSPAVRCGIPGPQADCANVDLELWGHIDNSSPDALVHLTAIRVGWPVELLILYWTMLAFLIQRLWFGSPAQSGKQQMAAVLTVAAMFLLGIRLLAAGAALDYSPTSLDFLAVRAQTMMEIVMVPILLRAMFLNLAPVAEEAERIGPTSSAAWMASAPAAWFRCAKIKLVLIALMASARAVWFSQAKIELGLTALFVTLLAVGVWLGNMLSLEQSAIMTAIAVGGSIAIVLTRQIASDRQLRQARPFRRNKRLHATAWLIFAAIVLLAARFAGYRLFNIQEEIRVFGQRVSVSTFTLPFLIVGSGMALGLTRNRAGQWLPRWLKSRTAKTNAGSQQSRSAGFLTGIARTAFPFWTFILFVFSGAAIVNDSGFVLVYIWPITIVATAYLVANRLRLALSRSQCLGLSAVPLLLAFLLISFGLVLAMWARAMNAGDLADNMMPSLLLNANFNRLLMLFGPDALVHSSSRSTFETLELALRLHGINEGNLFGQGYMADGLRLGIMRSVQLSDNLPAIHLIWPFGRLGAAAFVLVMCAIPVALGGAVGPLRSARSVPALTAHLSAWLLAGTAAYMVLANMALAPFTGRNIFLLSATSWSDVVESLTLFALIAWPGGKDQP